MYRDARHVGDVIIITPSTERIAGEGAEELEQQLVGAVAHGHTRVLLDLSGVTFIDSKGLAAILSVIRQLDGNGDLRLCAPRPEVRSVIELARLHRIVPVYDRVADAIGELGLRAS